MISPDQLALSASSLFPDLALGDARRQRRFDTVVRAIAQNPGASLPELFPHRTDYNACLRLFDAPECSHENILGAHQEATLQAMERHSGVVLLLHDATMLDFSGHTTLEDDLGQIGNGGGTGWVSHQSLAINPANRMVFGLVSQLLHVREGVGPDEPVAAKRDRQSRESLLWQRALDEIGPTPAGASWIDVCDRGADVFEFLQQLHDRNRRFVVRSTHNRALGRGPSDAKSAQRLHDQLRQVEATARWELDIPTKAGKPGRIARLCAAGCRVELRPPHVKKGRYRDAVVPVGAIRIWEDQPPPGTEALEWLLLTGEPVDTPAQLRQVGAWYACRMQIEEYHKVQKSGANVEGCQVQSVAKMAALVAVLSVVAVGLMNLRLAVRDPKVAAGPAEAIVPRLWVEVLRRYRGGPAATWTAGEFWVALARLGGYQKNPVKHPPGWITLWRGWRQLHPLIRYHNLSTPKMP